MRAIQLLVSESGFLFFRRGVKHRARGKLPFFKLKLDARFICKAKN